MSRFEVLLLAAALCVTACDSDPKFVDDDSGDEPEPTPPNAESASDAGIDATLADAAPGVAVDGATTPVTAPDAGEVAVDAASSGASREDAATATPDAGAQDSGSNEPDARAPEGDVDGGAPEGDAGETPVEQPDGGMPEQPTCTPGVEVCNGVDDDCDGQVDEEGAPSWYVDCDHDGYAATLEGAQRACTAPAELDGCGWTAKAPNAEAHTDWDCNDKSAAYHPGADFGLPPEGQLDPDLDCDGRKEPGLPARKICSPGVYFDIERAVCSAAALEENSCVYWLSDSINPATGRPFVRPNPPSGPSCDGGALAHNIYEPTGRIHCQEVAAGQVFNCR